MSLKNPVTPPGIDYGIVRLVAQRLNDYATPDPIISSCSTLNFSLILSFQKPLSLSSSFIGLG